MHAEEVDLSHLLHSLVHPDMHGHRGDAAHQGVILYIPHSHMPVPEETRWGECPLKEWNGIVES